MFEILAFLKNLLTCYILVLFHIKKLSDISPLWYILWLFSTTFLSFKMNEIIIFPNFILFCDLYNTRANIYIISSIILVPLLYQKIPDSWTVLIFQEMKLPTAKLDDTKLIPRND